MTAAHHQNIAATLRDAYRGAPIAPVRETLSVTDTDGAYAVQEINTRFWLAAGRKIVGRKIGLTSKAVQQQFNVDQPDYGMLFEDKAVAHDGRVASGTLIQPRVEGEIALFLKDDLPGPAITVADVIDAVEWLAPAIEIVDSRIRNWDISIVDTIADNASSGMFVIGPERKRAKDVDVVECAMTLTCDGAEVSRGKGAACLGSPFISSQWLAQKMADVGRPLRRGDLVLSGALGPMVAAKPGCAYEVAVAGLGAARVGF